MMKWKSRIQLKLKKGLTLNPSPKERDFFITDFTNPVQFESGFLFFGEFYPINSQYNCFPSFSGVFRCFSFPILSLGHGIFRVVFPKSEIGHGTFMVVFPKMEIAHGNLWDVFPKMEIGHGNLWDVFPKSEIGHGNLWDVFPKSEIPHGNVFGAL